MESPTESVVNDSSSPRHDLGTNYHCFLLQKVANHHHINQNLEFFHAHEKVISVVSVIFCNSMLVSWVSVKVFKIEVTNLISTQVE